MTWLDVARRVAVSTLLPLIGHDGKCASCKRRMRIDGARWRCLCGARGDGVGLVARHVLGGPWAPGDRQAAGRLRAWFAHHGLCEAAGQDARAVAS